ncbi:MAG: hypothetical protein ABII71_06180 [Candidatus Micrarchaeota archaeon]
MADIDIVALGKSRPFSVAKVTVSKEGDVHFIPMMKGVQCHFSRLHDGSRHMKIFDGNGKLQETHELSRGAPVSRLRGVETLPAQAFRMEQLEPLPRKKGQKAPEGLFKIEMRDYSNSTFSLHTFLFREEGREMVQDMLGKYRKVASYMYMESSPMIAMLALDAEERK